MIKEILGKIDSRKDKAEGQNATPQGDQQSAQANQPQGTAQPASQPQDGSPQTQPTNQPVEPNQTQPNSIQPLQAPQKAEGQPTNPSAPNTDAPEMSPEDILQEMNLDEGQAGKIDIKDTPKESAPPQMNKDYQYEIKKLKKLPL